MSISSAARTSLRIVVSTACLMAFSFSLYSAEPPRSAGSIKSKDAGGWWSVGTMPAPTWDGKTLGFRSDRGNLAITPLSDDVIRVRFTTAKSFGRDHSYAVINRGTWHRHRESQNWFRYARRSRPPRSR